MYMYMAVVTSKYLDQMQQLLAYQMLIVLEACQRGGCGRLAYYSYFHQQVATDVSADWLKQLRPDKQLNIKLL